MASCLRLELLACMDTTSSCSWSTNFMCMPGKSGMMDNASRATYGRRGRNGTNMARKSSGIRSAAEITESSSLQAAETVQLGQSGVRVPQLGIGAWSWGDQFFWHEGGWNGGRARDAQTAFETAVDVGLPFFDTAEVYGQKLPWGGDDSENLLGRFIKERKKRDTNVVVATKFAALPWRLGRQSVVAALRASLRRLSLDSIDLYQLHWPGLWGNEGFIDGLGDAVDQGLVKAVGVSNYKESRLRDAYAQLKKRGIVLASNQVHYSLAYRLPEKNGVKRTCDELGISLIAYSPLGQGVLTGKYTPDNLPRAARGRTYNREFLLKIDPLLKRMKEIGAQYNKSQTQVALNWLVSQGNVIPIPGAKSGDQAKEFAGALGWKLSESEVEELRYIGTKVDPVIGFPAEWF